MTRVQTILLIGLFFLTGIPASSSADEIVQTLFDITFDENAETNEQWNQWRAGPGCRTVIRGELLHIESLQGLPQFSRNANFSGGEFQLIVELRTGTESNALFNWTSRGAPRYDENKIQLPLNEDGDWHSYKILFTVPDILTGMRLSFSALDGAWDIRSMKLIRQSRPPLTIREIAPFSFEDREGLRFNIANEIFLPVQFHFGNQE